MDNQRTIFDQHRDGATFDPEHDLARLNAQHRRVYEVMADGAWHSLPYIAAMTGDPEASISARLRDFRKARFGGHTVNRRRLKVYTDDKRGLWQYQLVWNPEVPRPPAEPEPPIEGVHVITLGPP